MGRSDSPQRRRGAETSRLRRAVFVLLLCVPNLLATLVLWALSASEIGSASAIHNVLESSILWLFMLATYGPVLALAALPVIVKLSNAVPRSALVVATTWFVFTFSVVAAVYFHLVLIWRLELP